MDEFGDETFETYYGSWESLECDYLVIGAGTRGMCFVDGLLSMNKTCKVIIVDERNSPGGQWHDAPSWFRVSQVSATYGVASRKLESDRPRTPGMPAERANRAQVLSYYDAVMEDFIRSGRVRFFPNCTANYDGTQIVSNSSGQWNVNVREKVVDTTFAAGELATDKRHKPPFKVHEGAKVVTPAGLSATRAAHLAYVVIGAGRVGIDTMLHLLDQGVPVDRLHWVMPRDPWLLNRDQIGAETKLEVYLNWEEALLTSKTVEDMYFTLERDGIALRLDPSVFPTCFHGAYIAPYERARLGRIRNFVRMGHVREVTASHLVFEDGVYNTGQGTLLVDCTSTAICSAPEPIPIWTDQRVTLQLVTETLCAYAEMSPCLSALVIGYVEGQNKSTEAKNDQCHPAKWPDTIWDWENLHHLHYTHIGKFQEDKKVQWKLMRCRPTNFAMLSSEALQKFSSLMERQMLKRFDNREEADLAKSNHAKALANSKGKQRRFSPRRAFTYSPMLVNACTQTDPREKPEQ